MADADRNPIVSIDPRYLLTGEVVERPPAERPKHDTIEAILDWLAGPAQQIPSLSGAFDEFAWRMLAAGFPLLRTTLQPARCTRNISAQALSGCARPVRPCRLSLPMRSRNCPAMKITQSGG